MAYRTYHGGECCGMTHLHGFCFDGRSRSAQVQHLSEVDQAMECEPDEHLWEIVLTDNQVKTLPFLVEGLKKRGFKLVSRFRNANSGNYCNVLHRYPLSGKGSGLKNSPYLNKRG